MSQKRRPEEGNGSSDEKRPRVPALRSVIWEVMKRNGIQNFFSGLEPLLRKVVKEEVEVALRNHLTSIKQGCGKQVHPSTSRSLRLKFSNRLSLPIFTGAKIEGEDNSVLKVILVDALTEEVIDCGPESSAKVEIVVLEGDFEGSEEENWTHEEFRNNIMKEREGKRPLLTGEASLNLNAGIGVVGELAFTDNSSWTRSRKFRLGARVVDTNCDASRVIEAKTEAFVVKDHRGELYKKHYPPSLGDEVWRVAKIGKDGAFHKRLAGEKINSVKDFLTLFHVDSPRLRNILGSGMSTKMWELTIDHARTCILDNRMYLYSPPDAQQKAGVVFNVVGRAMGVLSEGRYVSFDELSENEKDDAQKLVKTAYEHWDEVISWENEGTIDSFSNSTAVSFPSQPMTDGSSFGNKFSNPHKSVEFSFTEPVASSSDIISSLLALGGTRSLDDYTLQDMDNLDVRHGQPYQVTTSVCETSITQSLCGEQPVRYFDPETSLQSEDLFLESQADLQAAVSGFIAMSARSAAIGKANTRWNMLYSLLRWRFSIKRIVASRRKTSYEKWTGAHSSP
ncbi:hypothetical protein Scep_017711 [Stephania cephalantha]|uniref:Calmodulin-binding protein n=1 Tax=Stephania cephalantha TaxID=152367 RepID=A0AAP0NUH3_9MAGN